MTFEQFVPGVGRLFAKLLNNFLKTVEKRKRKTKRNGQSVNISFKTREEKIDGYVY